MSDKEIEPIPFRTPDKALFDDLQQFVEAVEHREGVEAWIDWGQLQIYERMAADILNRPFDEMMLERQVRVWEGEGGRDG